MATLTKKLAILTSVLDSLSVYLTRSLVKQQRIIVCVSHLLLGLAPTLNAIASEDSKAIAILVDVGNVTQLSPLTQQVQDILAPIDIFVNNVGTVGTKINRVLGSYSLAQIQLLLNSKLLAAMKLTDFLLPKMMERGSGRIVNIASLATTTRFTWYNIYSASIASWMMWTDATVNFCQQLVKNTANPGYVAVGFDCP